MATLWLSRRDCEEGKLPRVCMRCGRSATCFVEKDLSGTLVWASPIAFLVGMISGEDRTIAKLHLPLCDSHRNHWRNRQVMLVGAAIVVLAVLGGLVALFSDPQRLREVIQASDEFIFLIPVGVMLAIYFAFAQTGIQATIIHEVGIRLFGVDREFARVYEIEAGLRGVDLNAIRAFRPRPHAGGRNVTNEAPRSQRFGTEPPGRRDRTTDPPAEE